MNCWLICFWILTITSMSNWSIIFAAKSWWSGCNWCAQCISICIILMLLSCCTRCSRLIADDLEKSWKELLKTLWTRIATNIWTNHWINLLNTYMLQVLLNYIQIKHELKIWLQLYIPRCTKDFMKKFKSRAFGAGVFWLQKVDKGSKWSELWYILSALSIILHAFYKNGG